MALLPAVTWCPFSNTLRENPVTSPWAGDLWTSCAANAGELAGLPGELGRARPELHLEIRSFAFKGYVIFFRYGPERFEIINVLHGHRDIESLFDR